MLHSTKVNSWIKATTPGMGPSELCDHFEFALSVLWFRSTMVVSDITIQAIFERIFTEAAEKFPILKPVTIKDNQIDLLQCCKNVTEASSANMIEAMTFVVTEFLAILGNITGEVISPHLHIVLNEIQSAANPTPELKLVPNHKVKK